MKIHIVVKIDKTNMPNTEPQDVTVKAFGTKAGAVKWMRRDFDATEEHETEGFYEDEGFAFKNDDEHEVLWVLK